MQVKCPYCDSFINDTDEKCPNCGGVNHNLRRMAKGTPKTIEELKQWYKDRGLPPEEKTRFFIGKNYTKPKAFGIYKENGMFIVYKNKANGERAIRYKGTDEAYAVNELYLKLKSEILNQKNLSANKKGLETSKKSSIFSKWKFLIPFLGNVFLLALIFAIAFIPMLRVVVCSIIVSFFLFIAYLIITFDIEQSKGKKFAVLRKIIDILNKKAPLHYLSAWLFITLLVVSLSVSYFTPRYTIGEDDNVYCKYRNHFYYYDGIDYKPVTDEIDSSYYSSSNVKYTYSFDKIDSDYEYDSDLVSFFDSDYYNDNFYSDDSDSDYDYGGGDWDAGGMDWDSDW